MVTFRSFRPRFAATMLLLTIFAGGPGASLASAANILPADQAFSVTAARTASDDVRLTFDMAHDTYLYRDQIRVAAHGKPLKVETPPGEEESDPAFGTVEIYRTSTQATFTPPPDGGKVTVSYRGCQDHGICYPPVHRTLDLATLTFAAQNHESAIASSSIWNRAGAPADPVEASPGGVAAPATSPADKSGKEPFAEKPSAVGISPVASDGDTTTAENGVGQFDPADMVAGAGWLLLVGSFIGFGLLLAFTPCVLPMYPILGGMLAGQGERLSSGRGFAVSLAYVLAMATAFGLLGFVAAWSGANLQIALQSPIALGVISAIFVLLALSMFGLFELALPAALTTRIAQLGPSRRGSLASAAALGFTSALIVGPCVTPPLAAALVYVTQTGDAWRGAVALFALGFGQGIPLLVFGTFGSGLLPKAGSWMGTVKHIFGFVFLAAAVYMISRIVPATAAMALWAVLLVVAGVFAGAFDGLSGEDGAKSRLGKAAGLLAVLYGGLLAVGASAGAGNPLDPLAPFAGGGASKIAAASMPNFEHVTSLEGLDRTLKQASSDGKPGFVYVTADWCISCKIIDDRVLPDAAVQRALDRYKLVEIDLTDIDKAKRGLMTKLGIVGPPTMLFYTSISEGTPAKRIVGEVNAKTLSATASSIESRM